MNANLTQSLTYGTVLSPRSVASNNTASSGFDTQGYIGQLAVRVALGVKTVGDNDGAVTVLIQASASNAAANATNITSTTFSVGTTNNTAASGTIVFDTRAEYRYLFARVILAGTNSPAYPVAVEAIGQKQVQPVQ